MKQCGFHWNKASITHFPRSLFGNLVSDSDQLFLPVDIFPPQDLVLGVFSDQFTAAEASETRHSKKRVRLASKVNPPTNALRHSYASYWLARSSKEGLGELSKRMGNSEAVCKRHYLETLTREEGKSWFVLRRSTGAP